MHFGCAGRPIKSDASKEHSRLAEARLRTPFGLPYDTPIPIIAWYHDGCFIYAS